MVAANSLLESCERHEVADERFASIEIDGDAIHGEAFQVMKSQMRD